MSGVFEAATGAAVRRLQRAHGLPTDGVVGSATRDLLAALVKPDG